MFVQCLCTFLVCTYVCTVSVYVSCLYICLYSVFVRFSSVHMFVQCLCEYTTVFLHTFDHTGYDVVKYSPNQLQGH